MKSFDETWEKIHATQEWGKYPSEPVIRFVARNFYRGNRKATKILDFGCGGGSHIWYLAREGFDGSKSAVRKVEEKLRKEKLQADVRVRDALELDYEENFFDCVIDNATIYANQKNNILEMYQQVYRLLKKGGKLFSVSFTTETTGYGTGTEIEKNTFCGITERSLEGRRMTHFYTEEELRNILQQAGFQNMIIDFLKFTDRGNIVEQFLVQAKK